MNSNMPSVVNMPYKLTVVISDRNRGYTDILKRRLGFKSKDKMMEALIEQRVSQLYSLHD